MHEWVPPCPACQVCLAQTIFTLTMFLLSTTLTFNTLTLFAFFLYSIVLFISLLSSHFTIKIGSLKIAESKSSPKSSRKSSSSSIQPSSSSKLYISEVSSPYSSKNSSCGTYRLSVKRDCCLSPVFRFRQELSCPFHQAFIQRVSPYHFQ